MKSVKILLVVLLLLLTFAIAMPALAHGTHMAVNPGEPNCVGTSVAELSRHHGSANQAAADHKFPSVKAMLEHVRADCQ